MGQGQRRQVLICHLILYFPSVNVSVSETVYISKERYSNIRESISQVPPRWNTNCQKSMSPRQFHKMWIFFSVNKFENEFRGDSSIFSYYGAKCRLSLLILSFIFKNNRGFLLNGLRLSIWLFLNFNIQGQRLDKSKFSSWARLQTDGSEKLCWWILW